MSPNDYFSPLEGQSLLIPGQDEKYRGQCVQSVGLYVQQLGISFPAYPKAYLYWDNGIPGYDKVGAGNPIKEGDIIIWRSDFPPSKGSGHIDVVAQDGTLANFVAWDSNWDPPLKLAKLSHLGNNNNYIVGYLRRPQVSKIEYSTITSTFADFHVPGPTPDQLVYYSNHPNGYDELHTDMAKFNLDARLAAEAQVAALTAELNATYTPYTGSELFVKK